MRLDQYLLEKGYCKSRQKAKELITQARVYVGGKIICKPAFWIPPEGTEEVVVDVKRVFPSRAGEKLWAFLETSKLEVRGKSVLDVGSSTGGFAQALLYRGARAVTCVDVGSHQLDTALREDPRIRLFEQCDIREFQTQESFDLLVCDVSFISLSKILDFLIPLSACFILLFKPQFEVGLCAKRSKKGVVLDAEAIKKRCLEFEAEIEAKGLQLKNMQKSSLKGKAGNEEFFFYIEKH
ncbi:TlyA family rRNA (cytidine-2'-O)-methyltransferase [Helicobacter sp. 12S02634-8]|uniref:23S rRNA (cytidine-2'-O)-methyltransferase TlyA n=1 Tax=Helicobacter sp. 12S02634-8 TaxID=1476199 RepID=UPI000BA54FEC|nr:TlyA family RNA methyltransferase [Helicobacter sp. 12S02634-8]PAF48401.1 TlyA family rRNA (cytidine-2'-O)-methyltransferase [Helicobacter sp. 12S02634-8]